MTNNIVPDSLWHCHLHTTPFPPKVMYLVFSFIWHDVDCLVSTFQVAMATKVPPGESKRAIRTKSGYVRLHGVNLTQWQEPLQWWFQVRSSWMMAKERWMNLEDDIMSTYVVSSTVVGYPVRERKWLKQQICDTKNCDRVWMLTSYSSCRVENNLKDFLVGGEDGSEFTGA